MPTGEEWLDRLSLAAQNAGLKPYSARQKPNAKRVLLWIVLPPHGETLLTLSVSWLEAKAWDGMALPDLMQAVRRFVYRNGHASPVLIGDRYLAGRRADYERVF